MAENEQTLEELQTQLAALKTEKEEALKARDKISEDYRLQRSEADKLKNFANNVRSTFESKGLAKFDDNYNITIIEQQQQANTDNIAEFDKQLSTIEIKMETLSEKLDSGDIDPDKYAKEHAKLIREENTISRQKDKELLKKELLETNREAEQRRAEQEQAGKVQQTEAQREKIFADKLAKEFPESLDVSTNANSAIIKEVNAIIAEQPELYPDITLLNTNLRERYNIFDKAYTRLIAKGVITADQQAKRQASTNAKFTTLNSGSYIPEEKNKSSFIDDSLAGNYIKNKFSKDTLKDLNDSFSKYEETGTLVIES